MGMVADPDKLESSITHLANIIDSNDDQKLDKTGNLEGTWQGRTIGDFASQDLTLYAKKQQGSWNNLVLQNGWAWQSQFTKPQVLKDEIGFVHLKGSIGGVTVTNGTIIATLPVGCRPSEKMFITLVSYGISSLQMISIYINIDGTITCDNIPNTIGNLPLNMIPPFAGQ